MLLLTCNRASRTQLSSECLVSRTELDRATAIFHSVDNPYPLDCSIPTIRPIITNRSSTQRLTGAWRSSLKCLPQLPIQIEIVTEVLGDMVQWASCLCLELAIPQTSGWCSMHYVELNNNTYLLWFQASEENTDFFVLGVKRTAVLIEVKHFQWGFYVLQHLKELFNHLLTK